MSEPLKMLIVFIILATLFVWGGWLSVGVLGVAVLLLIAGIAASSNNAAPTNTTIPQPVQPVERVGRYQGSISADEIRRGPQ